MRTTLDSNRTTLGFHSQAQVTTSQRTAAATAVPTLDGIESTASNRPFSPRRGVHALWSSVSAAPQWAKHVAYATALVGVAFGVGFGGGFTAASASTHGARVAISCPELPVVPTPAPTPAGLPNALPTTTAANLSIAVPGGGFFPTHFSGPALFGDADTLYVSFASSGAMLEYSAGNRTAPPRWSLGDIALPANMSDVTLLLSDGSRIDTMTKGPDLAIFSGLQYLYLSPAVAVQNITRSESTSALADYVAHHGLSINTTTRNVFVQSVSQNTSLYETQDGSTPQAGRSALSSSFVPASQVIAANANASNPASVNDAGPVLAANNFYTCMLVANCQPAIPQNVTYTVVNRTLFAPGQTGPTSREVVQGAVGDCFFDATLLSAVDNAEVAANLITQVTPSTYKVRFYNPSVDNAPVHVFVDNQLPTLRDGSVLGDGAESSLWAPLVEKAFAKFNDAFAVLSGPTNLTGYLTLNGGGTNQAQQPLTGYKSFMWATRHMLPAVLWSTLSMANVGIGVIIGTQINATDLVGSHAYAVQGTAIDAQGRGNVSLRNPWGLDASLSFEKFSDNVQEVWFTVGAPSPGA